MIVSLRHEDTQEIFCPTCQQYHKCFLHRQKNYTSTMVGVAITQQRSVQIPYCCKCGARLEHIFTGADQLLSFVYALKSVQPLLTELTVRWEDDRWSLVSHATSPDAPEPAQSIILAQKANRDRGSVWA